MVASENSGIDWVNWQFECVTSDTDSWKKKQRANPGWLRLASQSRGPLVSCIVSIYMILYMQIQLAGTGRSKYFGTSWLLNSRLSMETVWKPSKLESNQLQMIRSVLELCRHLFNIAKYSGSLKICGNLRVLSSKCTLHVGNFPPCRNWSNLLSTLR